MIWGRYGKRMGMRKGLYEMGGGLKIMDWGEYDGMIVNGYVMISSGSSPMAHKSFGYFFRFGG